VDSTVEINGGSITDNTATANGGGLYVTTNVTQESTAGITASVNINGGYITGNTATGSGGGVYVTGNRATNKDTSVEYIGMVNVTITGGSVTNNTAAADGGGLYVTSLGTVAVAVEGGSITGNYAVNGGGIAVFPQDGAEAAVAIGTSGCTEKSDHSHPVISNNTASGDGGGVYISEGTSTVTMYCGNITSNKNSSGITSNDVTQNGGTFTQTGGIIAESPTMNGGSFYDQTAGSGTDVTYIYYKVIYNSNTGEDVTSEVGLSEADSSDINHKWMTITLPANTMFSQEGKYITGWNTDSNTDSAIYSANEEVTLHDLITTGTAETENGIGTQTKPYVISFYAVWTDATVNEGVSPSYEVTIPADMTIGTGDYAEAEVRASLNNFRYNNYLNITVSSANVYSLRNGDSYVHYELCKKGELKEVSGDSGASAVSDETTEDKLTNNSSVLSFKKGVEVQSASLTQKIIAKLSNEADSKKINVAGTYTDILTFTVNFG
jgi:predicted outer membrane repeat protein